jgi:hypothetical protein
MKAKAMPDTALVPARDPLLDESLAEKVGRAATRWGLGIAAALGLALAAALLDHYDDVSARQGAERRLEEASRQNAAMRHRIALREASGSCQTLFYLVEADDMVSAGEKLVQASLRTAEAANDFRDPLPPLTTGTP